MTAIAPVPVRTLSDRVASATVVMIGFNTKDRFLVPGWIASVPSRPVGEPAEVRAPGTKVFEGRRVDMQYILDDLRKEGFVPTKLVVIERSHDNTWKQSLVYVRRKDLKPGDLRLPQKDLEHVEKNLLYHLWNVRGFRNEGEGDGNFSIEAGAPITPVRGEVEADLRIRNGKFVLVEG